MGSILLVEPDPDANERWSAALHTAGHSILVAKALREAPTLVGEGGIDVVVIDCGGQCVGVVDTARAIEMLPDAPPIILVSSSPAAPEISARIGAAAFLPKPCEPSELVEAITRLMGEHRPVRYVDDEPTNMIVDERTRRRHLGG